MIEPFDATGDLVPEWKPALRGCGIIGRPTGRVDALNAH